MSNTTKHRPEGGHVKVDEYSDELHGEDLEGIEVGEYGYKYRMLEGLVMPPYITPERYALSRTIETRPGDVCFTSYPKSGSTWLSYVLLLLLGDGAVPEGKTLRDCLHWVASSWPYPRSREELEALPSPRIFKSHMPYSMAVGGDPAAAPCKYLYIARNPKDVCVSYYVFESDKAWSGGFSPPWEHWLELFIAGKVQRGPWFDHVLSWWEHRNAPNVLFLRYEDMLEDPRRELETIARFLDKPLTDDLAAAIVDETAFDRMKANPFSNLREISQLGSFFRKGRVGAWKERFTPAQSDAFDRLCAERLAGTGLEFRYA